MSPVGHGAPVGPSATRAAEAGITLVELLVVVTILGIVMAGLFGGLTGIVRATNTIDVRTENVDQARLAIASLSRDLRTAAPGPDGEAAFLVADDRNARFHAQLGQGEIPVLVELRVDAEDRLVETVTPPTVAVDGTVSYDPDDTRERFVASYLFNGDDEPIITYLALEPDGSRVALETPVTDPQLRRSIRLVRIELVMARDQGSRVEPQRVATEVRLPNLRGGA